MVIPFSNTKLHVPKGFQSLLVGLSTEVLRSQPRNIYLFAAEYFENLLQRREQGHVSVSDKQTALEDRYYNNQSFQDEYPINASDANNAATKIQAQFRGHKTRKDLEKIKQENKQIDDSDYGQSSTPNNEYQSADDELQSEEEKREQERAAISIQANFRGYQTRKNLREPFGTKNDHEHQEFDNNYDKIPTPKSTHFSDHDEIQTSKYDDIDRPRFDRESSQLSEDFERHTQIPRDSSFAREQQVEFFNDEDDMNDPNLDKAATRIQASYRGYKIRKELGTSSGPSNTGHDPTSMSPQTDDEYNNARNKNILSPSAEGNRVLAGEGDDNAAAVKIQAAYRGYRVRKDLEK